MTTPQKQRRLSQSPRSSPDRFVGSASRAILHSRTESPTPRSKRSPGASSTEYEDSLAHILGLESDKVLTFSPSPKAAPRQLPLPETSQHKKRDPVQLKPYKILDAPQLSDDFYSSILAWSPGGQLAVALKNNVHLWSEKSGQKHIPGTYMDFANGIMRHRADVTAVDYSSNNRWLAVARKDGLVQVFARLEGFGNAEVRVLGDVACMAFRPETGIAKTDADQFLRFIVKARLYSVKALPLSLEFTENKSPWNHDGSRFASGGNDNKTCLFEAQSDQTCPFQLKYTFQHQAAVKALAFCPWSTDTLAAGGGSQDRKIRFFNASSGQLMSTLPVNAQVTSIIWSTEYRELATTFGYAADQSPHKIKIFTWPDLHCIVSCQLPRGLRSESRAIYAVSKTEDVIVASTDETIRFYKFFAGDRMQVYPEIGLGGGRVVNDQDLMLLEEMR